MNKRIFLEEIYPIMQEQLDHGGKAAFNITGTSMNPFLYSHRDSVSLIKPKYELKKHDIILYRRSDGTFVLHRIVKKPRQKLICRGDNQTENEAVERKSVIAIVVEYRRNGKLKNADCISHKIYSLLWVNTAFIRRAYRGIKRRLLL